MKFQSSYGTGCQLKIRKSADLRTENRLKTLDNAQNVPVLYQLGNDIHLMPNYTSTPGQEMP